MVNECVRTGAASLDPAGLKHFRGGPFQKEGVVEFVTEDPYAALELLFSG